MPVMKKTSRIPMKQRVIRKVRTKVKISQIFLQLKMIRPSPMCKGSQISTLGK